MHRTVAVALLGALGAAVAPAQPTLHLKARISGSLQIASSEMDTVGLKRLTPGRIHRVVQFAAMPTADNLRRLERQGAVVLQYVPDQAVLVNSPDRLELDMGDVILAESLTAFDKLSPQLSVPLGVAELIKEADSPLTRVVVELYPDVAAAIARQIATAEGVQLREHADLAPGHLLVEATMERLRRLAEWDEVAYIYPASPELERAESVHVCAGALTQYGMVGQYVGKIGDGWDGPGRHSAKLKYLLEGVPGKLPADQARAEIERALAEWSRVVDVDFSTGSGARERGLIHILFASGAHGDPYPFDGPGRVLAHTFYPAPPNPEPLAGDLHLDETESWKIGNDIDLYSVALHELGHALGLGHSDKPGAVMYAYYRQATSLTEEDISAVRELYAARSAPSGGGEPPATPTPAPAPAPAPNPAPATPPTPSPANPDRSLPILSIASPQSTSVQTNAASISIKGSASDNVGVTRVGWTSNVNGDGIASGTTQWSATIPLAVGFNTIIVRAHDAAGNSAWRSLVVTRK